MPSDETHVYSYFLPYQIAWIRDTSTLKIMQKSRQVGISYADAYDSVRKVCQQGARLDVWISSRDEAQAKLYIEDCKKWAALLQAAAVDLGRIVIDAQGNASANVLRLASGRRIYSLSSNPNALAGKRGHVKLDEFALHPDQQLLYRVAKPVTTWGGTLSIISTHRGTASVFNKLIGDITERGNTMHWSLHTVSLQDAVRQGLVERINQKNSRNESREDFLARLEAECIDREQWLQEYCCVPADESTAFISYEMITTCEDPELQLMTMDQLEVEPADAMVHTASSARCLFLGLDVARKKDLCVLDVGEKIGDVVWDRTRIELAGRTFSEIECELYRWLRLPQLKRACIDATGMGWQLAERAQERFGWKVEPITFSAPVKEELAFALRTDFEDRKIRIVSDDNLRSDLRALKKEVTSSGNFRFAGEAGDSHCDRFWAKALRQHAARYKVLAGAAVG
jgi:phage FluMu gp28-like protein